MDRKRDQYLFRAEIINYQIPVQEQLSKIAAWNRKETEKREILPQHMTRTGYTAAGTPLAVMQDDILVVKFSD